MQISLRIPGALLLTYMLSACASHLPQLPSDFDVMPHMVSKHSFQSNEEMRDLFDRIRAQIDACLVRTTNMYVPGPVQVGKQLQTATIGDSGRSAQIILEQRGVQSYLIARLSFTNVAGKTRVETASKIPQSKSLDPLFASWIDFRASACKVSQ